MKGFISIMFVPVLVIIGILAVMPFVLKAECAAKTEGMGFNSKWTLLGGCKIEYKPGVWIPLDRYTVSDD
jgi:hypothetical protein